MVHVVSLVTLGLMTMHSWTDNHYFTDDGKKTAISEGSLFL